MRPEARPIEFTNGSAPSYGKKKGNSTELGKNNTLAMFWQTHKTPVFSFFKMLLDTPCYILRSKSLMITYLPAKINTSGSKATISFIPFQTNYNYRADY